MTLSFRTMGRAAAVAPLLAAVVACGDAGRLTGDAAPSTAAAAAAQLPADQELARLVAGALREPGVRTAFFQATSASPVKEGKLHLRSYLRGPGNVLLRGMVRAGGTTEAEVHALLDRVGPVEIYLPVPAHRAAWNGGADLLVAIHMDKESEPFGVDLNGREVQLTSAAPPATPTVSIVHAESFDARGEAYENHRAISAPAGPSFSMVGSGAQVLVATFINLKDVHEPWTSGDPEIELHVTGKRSAADGSARLVQCAGEHANRQGAAQPGIRDQSYVFDMNSKNWWGTVRVLNAAQMDTLQTAEFNGYNVSIWEDDDTSCTVKQKSHKDYFKNMISATSNAVAGWVAIKGKDWKTVAASFGSALTDLYDLAVGGDDYVGVMVRIEETPYNGMFTDANHIIYQGTTYYGRAWLEVR